jgi:hypothetical protein
MTPPAPGPVADPTRQDPVPPKQRKHLMTPGQLRPQPARSMSLTSVQRWVASSIAVSTLLHMSVGLVFAAHYVDEQSSKIGLIVIAGAFGLMSMASGLLIHGKSFAHPLMLAGLLPPLLGGWWVLS